GKRSGESGYAGRRRGESAGGGGSRSGDALRRKCWEFRSGAGQARPSSYAQQTNGSCSSPSLTTTKSPSGALLRRRHCSPHAQDNLLRSSGIADTSVKSPNPRLQPPNGESVPCVKAEPAAINAK